MKENIKYVNTSQKIKLKENNLKLNLDLIVKEIKIKNIINKIILKTKKKNSENLILEKTKITSTNFLHLFLNLNIFISEDIFNFFVKNFCRYYKKFEIKQKTENRIIFFSKNEKFKIIFEKIKGKKGFICY